MKNDCTDKQFEKQLYAYELGLLPDDEREALEIHLLECGYCYQRLREFSHTARQIMNDPIIQDKIRELAGPEVESPAGASPGRWKLFGNKLWPALFRPGLVTAVIVAVLLLQPWKIQFKPDNVAVAERNRIAVLDFENLADPEDPLQLGEIATQLLITDLSESSYLQVMSSQRIDDILKRLGEDAAAPIDPQTTARIADEADAKWILKGAILQTEPAIIMTSQLINADKNEIAASARIVGQPGEKIFSVVDQMTVAIKDRLPLPASAHHEPDKMVADVTTHSPEAYRYYLDGIDKYNQYYFDEAKNSFETAIKYDSTFASAYFHLAKLSKGYPGYFLIKKAKKYADKASHKERMYINSLHALYTMKKDEAISILEKMVTRYPDEKEAFMLLGGYIYADLKFEKAIEYYSQVIKIDPLYESAYNMLAYSHDRIGETDRAIEAINKYISLAPDQPNPYDSRGEIYGRNGRLEEAIASYEQALERKPDFMASIVNLGAMYMFSGQYSKAAAQFRKLIDIGDKTRRPSGRLYLACVPIYRGELDQGLDRLEEALGADRLELANPTTVFDYTAKILVKARLLAEQDRTEEAVEVFEQYMLSHMTAYPGNLANFWNLYIQLLAENGDFEKADRAVGEMKQLLEYHQAPLVPYYYSQGCIEFEKNNFAAAIEWLEMGTSQNPTFTTDYMLARAYQEAGMTRKAIKKYERLISTYTTSRFLFGLWSVKMHYYLGRLYDQAGQRDKAVSQYEIFTSIWTNPEAWPEAHSHATSRLTALSQR